MTDVDESNNTPSSILDPGTLRRLFKQLDATDIDELEVETGDSRLFLRREPGNRSTVVRHESGDSRHAGLESPGVPITAPLTGVFYSRESPGQLPYAALGDAIEVGQVVALIETMKLFNEVTSDVAGEVMSVGPEDGDAVQEGQILFVIEPPPMEPGS